MIRQQRTIAVLRLAAVAVFLGGQLGAYAHDAFVQHRVCAEHGVLEDVAGGHGSEALPVVPETARHTIVSAGSDSSGKHDHCGVDSVTREPTCQPSDTRVVTLAPEQAAPHAGALEVGITAGVIYRLAPKQSPPA
jgi:hypothetical protein